jgi:transcriptional regulator with XRE-family HTH domain
MSEQEQTPAEETLRWHNFGEWLTQTRLELGYTQAYVAGKAGISAQSLVSLEHGGFRRHAGGPWSLPNPRDDIVKALARIYRVSVEEMFQRVGRYDDRPQTKSGLLRRASGASRTSRADRIGELEARNAELLKRIQELEARFGRTQALLEEHGIGAPEAERKGRRRSAPGS